MKAKPLSKAIYDKAKSLGVKKIELHFSGGSDEGCLDVEFYSTNSVQFNEGYNEILCDVEEWAWSVYDYSGAGDGTPYGDTIVYDLKTQRVTTQEWSHEVSYSKEKEENYDTI